MKCYFHNETDAVGVCSHCHRAVCSKHGGCGRYEEHHLFCKNHNPKTLSLDFTRNYIAAIDLAREAGIKGVRIADVIQDLQQKLEAASG